MKKFVFALMCVMCIMCSGCAKAAYVPSPVSEKETTAKATEMMQLYETMSDNIINDVIQIYEPDELTRKILVNRKKNGTIIIEKIIGVVNGDKHKDGKILNTKYTEYNYISYRDIKNAHKGNVFLTLLVYDAETKAIDDVCTRIDFKIEGGNVWNLFKRFQLKGVCA